LLRLANDKRLLNLPDGMKTLRDPFKRNRFKVDDERHKIWAEATRRANEELGQFKSGLLEIALHSPTTNTGTLRRPKQPWSTELELL
jgi:hypothetical protein